jgi:hypothetical protein
LIATDAGNTPDYYQYGTGVDLGFRFRRGEGWSPFVLMGTGIVRNDVVTDKDNDFYGDFGGKNDRDSPSASRSRWDAARWRTSEKWSASAS